MEETASPFRVWSITFAGHLKKGKKRKGKASAFPPSLSVVLLRAPAALLIEPRMGGGGQRAGGDRGEEMETCILALPLSPSLSTLPPPLSSHHLLLPFLTLLLFLSSPPVFPSPVGSSELPLERDSWHKMSLIIFPYSWLCLQDSRREWRSSRPELVLGWQKIHPGHGALGSLGRKLSRGSPHLLSSSLTVLWQSEEEAELAEGLLLSVWVVPA